MCNRVEENHIFPFLWMRGEDESILRNEIQKIHECGIGAVCVEARPHEGFCKAGWWHDMDIVIDEAKKHDMKIWILDDKHFPTGYANGLIAEKYPERKKTYIASTVADIFGSGGYQTLDVKRMLRPTIGFWEIGNPVDLEERAKNKLLAVVAIRCAQGRLFHEDTVNLTDKVEGDYVNFELPKGQWRVHVIYKTRTDGGDSAYINMIDRESASTQIEAVYEPHYKQYREEFGKTIAGFFSDEPQFGNIKEVCFDAKLGKPKMPLPWSDELQQMMEEKYGSKYVKFLPYLFEETEEKDNQLQMRFDYMDFVSKLYQKNFSEQIGDWCRTHGVEYIGHVVEDNGAHSRLGMGAAHYFRAMAGQDMAGIDVIGGQIVYGAPTQTRKQMTEIDGEFFHYALGKMGVSCGQSDPKKKGRTMCELFGAYGWKFGVRDMKYLLDHLLVKGINYLVPHAFSMAEYPDMDCPPHFYARGNNPQFPYFAELMKYGNRMCDLLSGGLHVASVAVLYDAEADWMGEHMPMQKVCRELLEHQIDFNIVSRDMLTNLEDYNGNVENNVLHINGMTFEALIVPHTEQIPSDFADFVKEYAEFPVIFVDGLPKKTVNGDNLCAIADCEVVNLENLSEKLKEKRMFDIAVDTNFKYLSFYHYVKDGKNLFVFLNESAEETFKGHVALPSEHKVVYYDAWNEEYKSADCDFTILKNKNAVSVLLELEPGECVVLIETFGEEEKLIHKSFAQQRLGCEKQVGFDTWKVSKVRAIDYPNFGVTEDVKTLEPISFKEPTFSGVIRYESEVTLDFVPTEAYFYAEHVYEVMKITVNGKEVGTCIRPPYQVDVTKALKKGKNEFVIEVATTPAREQLNAMRPPFDFCHETLEPTGMFGDVKLLLSAKTSKQQ